MNLPDPDSVQAQIAAFEADLAAAKSPRDAQTVRDTYLGRKNSVVASWMRMIAGAPPDQHKSMGRLANAAGLATASSDRLFLSSVTPAPFRPLMNCP